MGFEQCHHHAFESKTKAGSVGDVAGVSPDFEFQPEVVLVVVERTDRGRLLERDDWY